MSSNQIKKERWLLASTFLNIVLAVSKLFVGIVTNTAVVVADGIHSLSDVVNSILIYASIKLAGKKSQRFPFGMHKLEDFAALIGAVVIIYAGFEIIRSVVLAEEHQIIMQHIAVVLGFLFAVLLSQIGFAFFEFKSSKKLNSPGVKTDLMDWLMDIGATIVAVSGIVLNYYNIPYAQKTAVIIIVLMIFHGAYGIIKDAMLTLLDASVDIGIIKKAESIIKSFPEVDGLDTLFIRKAGSILIADIILQIKEKSVYNAHSVVESIERSLKDNIEHLEIITIHYEPSKNIHKKYALLLDKNREYAKTLKDIMSVKIVEIDQNGKESETIEYKNPFYEKQKGHFMKLAAWLSKEGVSEILIDNMEIEQEKIDFLESLDIRISKSYKSNTEKD